MHSSAASEGTAEHYLSQQRALCRLVSLRDRAQRDTQLCYVCEGLYLGSMGAASNLEGLKANGVTHVLNISPIVPCFYRKKALRYSSILVYDDPQEDIAQHFEAMNRFIAKGRRKGAVLVHCFAGQSRSVTAVLAYLLGREGMSLAEALCLVLAARPSAKPNRGFMQQLEVYEASLRPVSPL